MQLNNLYQSTLELMSEQVISKIKSEVFVCVLDPVKNVQLMKISTTSTKRGGLVPADPTRFAHLQIYAAVERRREEHEHWGTDSRRLQIEKERQENKGKGKGTKGKFAVPLQAIRESKGRGK